MLHGVHDLGEVVVARMESNVRAPAGVQNGASIHSSEVEIRGGKASVFHSAFLGWEGQVPF